MHTRTPSAAGTLLAATLLIGLAAAVPSAAHADGALNGRISFTSFRDGALGDIWTMNPDGGELRKLTTDTPGAPPIYDAQADWSPDGRRIAFRRGPNASTRLGVWTMTRYGDEQRLLAEGDPSVPRQNATQPAWAPDGATLLFRANRPPFADTDIWEMDPDGGSRRLVAHLPGEQLYPSYSPDKSRIAFTSPVAGDRAILTAAPDGSDVRVVFDTPGVDDSAPNWSPDGRSIAFESAVDGDGEIYVIDADGSDLRQLTDNAVHDEGPSWSPDGQRIVFTSGPGNLEGDIWVMNADGSGRTQVTHTPGRDESPDWQPIPHAGEYEPCGDAVDAGPGAYSVKVAGSGLTCSKARDVATAWSPRGHRTAGRIAGFACASSDAGYGALLIECAHRGNRGDGDPGAGNGKAIAWLQRGAPAG
jgi:Tol biopolymer transport system component